MSLQNLYPVEIKISFDQLSRALIQLRHKHSSIDIPPVSLASLKSYCTELFYTQDEQDLNVHLHELDFCLFRNRIGLASDYFTILCQEILSDLRENLEPLTHH